MTSIEAILFLNKKSGIKSAEYRIHTPCENYRISFFHCQPMYKESYIWSNNNVLLGLFSLPDEIFIKKIYPDLNVIRAVHSSLYSLLIRNIDILGFETHLDNITINELDFERIIKPNLYVAKTIRGY